MTPFQVFNQVFRRGLIVGDNILNAAAKCGLDRRLVLFLRLQKIAEIYREYQSQMKKNNALDFDDLLVKTVELFLLHDLPNTVSIAVVPLGDVL